MRATQSNDILSLQRAVQSNCDICDARHAADYSMCIYLMKMRELFRWEMGLGYLDEFAQERVGNWLRAKESRWQSLQDADFSPLPLAAERIDPFDAAAVNRRLLPQGLVYSGGYGLGAVPHFFLARLQRRERHAEFEVLVCGEELARDLSAPPAMAQGSTIFLRRQSVQRMLWEKVQESGWHAGTSATRRLLDCYDFAGDPLAALEQLTDDQLGQILNHEIGEVEAGKRLGATWEQMLAAFAGSRTEQLLRAVRDLLADSLVTLPRLLSAPSEAALHFYASNLTAMRAHLFPAFHPIYNTWVETGDWRPLGALVERSRAHWLRLSESLAADYAEAPAPNANRIQAEIEAARLD